MINTKQMWETLVAKTHNIKPNNGNLLERETLLVSQVLLGQYELAKSEKNEELIKFCADVLETYEKHDINGHIVWEK